MPNNDFHNENEPNAIERDRMERRMQTKRKSRITSILVVVIGLAVIIGVIIAIVSLVGKNKKGADNAEPTAVTATIASETEAAKSQETTAASEKPSQAKDPALNNRNSSSQSGDQQETTASSGVSSDASSQSSSGASSEANGSVSGSGNTLHYTATGQTSYGYDWTYSGGGGIVDIKCDYNFSSYQYDFQITGLAPGTASLTLYYNTADGVQQPVNMTVQVDSNLNVTQIG